MAKKKNTNKVVQRVQRKPDIVDQFVKATDAMITRIPFGLEPEEVAQHAKAAVRLAATPDRKAAIDGYTKVVNVLVKRENSRAKMLDD